MKGRTLITALGLIVVSATGAGVSGLFSGNTESKKTNLGAEIENETIPSNDLDSEKLGQGLKNLDKDMTLEQKSFQSPQLGSKENKEHYWDGEKFVFPGKEGFDYRVEDTEVDDCLNKEGRYSLLDSEKKIYKCFIYTKKS